MLPAGQAGRAAGTAGAALGLLAGKLLWHLKNLVLQLFRDSWKVRS